MRPKHPVQMLVFVFVVLVLIAANAYGCSCSRLAICEQFDLADTVFIGKVTGSKEQRIGRYDDGERETETVFDVGEIYFEVIEAFRGTVAGRRLTILSNTGGGDCGYWFRRGETYVVFASREKTPTARLWTSLCSGTAALGVADEALGFLRNIPKPGSGGTILGTVYESTRNYELLGQVNPAYANLRVSAVSVGRRGRVFSAATDRDGRYEIKVPPGRYFVRPELPPGTTDIPESVRRKPLAVGDAGCRSEYFTVYNDGRISGRVVDSAGRPNGAVTLELIPAAAALENRFRGSQLVSAATDGTFSEGAIPLGKYILGLNFGFDPTDDRPYGTYFYPGTADRSKAKVFEIGPGSKIGRVVFKLPPKLFKLKIRGAVLWADGTPAAGAEVRLRDIDAGSSVFFSAPVTDARGEFDLEWFAGRKYRLEAIVWEKTADGGAFSVAEGESEEFVLTAATPPFVIRLAGTAPNKSPRSRTTVRAN
ncbi:MAG: hypothetical protein IPJ30_26580 [Acidobacteria bacterium]|nr:hypothetical protein [Acidobacteriota bacterium]